MDQATTLHPAVEGLRALRDSLGALDPAVAEDAAIDRIRVLEEIKGACAAAQARESMALDRLRRDRETAEALPAEKRCQGLGAEIALARRDPAHQGGRHLGLARALCQEMPHTMRALSAGTISEYQATVMVRETAWVSAGLRREIDALMSARLGRVGTRRLAAEAKAHAQRLDQEEAARYLERSVRERRVSVRPAPGGMAYLTALLPLHQAVAALASLKRDAATAVGVGDEQSRTHDQITADLLVERVTGQVSAAAVPVEVHLVMTDGALMGSDPDPAWIPGQGPLPAETARRLLSDPEAEVFLRRLYTRPEDGQLVSMDSLNRVFPPLLRRMILLRDDVCRTPWCEAPIRHADHVLAHRVGGPTSFDNGSGLCAACNFTKERPGWSHAADPGGLTVTTPTGHRYPRDAVPLLPVTAGSTSPPAAADPPEPPPPPGYPDRSRRWRSLPDTAVAEARLQRCLREHLPALRLARLAMASVVDRREPVWLGGARRILDSRTGPETSRPTPTVPSRGGP